MRRSRVKAKLITGEPVLVTTCHFTDPSVFELTSLLGFDAIWIDLEHHATSVETASQLMRAARVGASDIIARPAKGEFMRMGRLLEAGAQGIMYPRCESAEEAAEVVKWGKFAPAGERGIDCGNPDNPYCFSPLPGYLDEANRETFLMVQLESPNSLDHVDAIAAVPGVDVLMFGPGDFSILAGIPGQFDHPLIHEAYRRVDAAAKRAGKWWATTSPSAEHSKMLLDLGANIVCHGGDLLHLRNGLLDMQRRFEPLGFKFDDRLNGPSAK